MKNRQAIMILVATVVVLLTVFFSTSESSVSAGNTAGWASVTGFRNASTDVQKNLVKAVKDLSGQASPQSVRRGDVTGGDWDVDTDGSDGARMRAGIQVYDAWVKAGRKPQTAAQIRQKVIDSIRLSATDVYTYTSSQRGLIADKIISQYQAYVVPKKKVIPTTDRDTLTFLEIKAQCREFVSRKVLGVSGGKSRTYGSGKVTNAADYRPGMGLYKEDGSNKHAMIITDIKWDSNGKPTDFKVAESNYGGGWSQNPPGQVPWSRTIGVGRIVTITACSTCTYYVVKFE